MLNSKAFERLTEQVVGRWIDLDVKEQGISQWKSSVLANVEHGNAPGGNTTHIGVLVHATASVDHLLTHLTC